MTQDELLELIADSDSEEWDTIPCWGASSGPSYRSRLAFYDKYNGQQNVLHAEEHAYVSVYKPDISITMAWGLKCNDNFNEDWANQFPDSHASCAYLDIFFNGALVFRVVYAVVDGGRAYLPLPDEGEKESSIVSKQGHDLIRLLDSLAHNSEFDSYFRRAGFKVTH